MNKFTSLDFLAIKQAYGYIPKPFKKLSQQQLNQINIIRLQNKYKQITTQPEDKWLDIMSNHLTRK
jgi:hypothetical protein